MAGNGGVNGSMLQYGGGQRGGGFGQKAGDGRKGAVGDDIVDCEGTSSAVEQIWQDWREGHF